MPCVAPVISAVLPVRLNSSVDIGVSLAQNYGCLGAFNPPKVTCSVLVNSTTLLPKCGVQVPTLTSSTLSLCSTVTDGPLCVATCTELSSICLAFRITTPVAADSRMLVRLTSSSGDSSSPSSVAATFALPTIESI